MATGLRDASEEAFAGGRWRPARTWEEDPAVADGAVKRVLVLGDIHNQRRRPRRRLDPRRTRTLRRSGLCRRLLAAGLLVGHPDPRTHTEGYPSLSWPPLMQLAMRAPVPVVVIDGNHEVWPCLAAYAQRPDVVEARAAGRPLHLGGTLWWADRGSTWTWGGRRCGALGGAVSPDKFIPRLAPYRWPDCEAPSRGDLQRLLANAPDGLDVLFCHDAPTSVGGLKGLPEALIPARILAECNEVRHLLQDRRRGDRTPPRVPRPLAPNETTNTSGDANTEVFGLNRDGRAGCIAIVDLDDHSGAYLTPTGD